MSQTTTEQEFIARFHFGQAPTPASETQLDSIELELETKLPLAYRKFMMQHGPVHTQIILKEIADREINHPDVQDFFSPDDVVKDTRGYWSAGMPPDVIGFASDCMGNMIGFRRHATRVEDAPVVFFDHDFVDIWELAPSFRAFLAWYVDNLKGRSGAEGK